MEAIYFKKPLLVNRYATFVSDIEPKGFDLVTMDGDMTAKAVQEVRDVLQSPQKAAEMVNLNYEVAKQHYSYGVLWRQLNPILDRILGKVDVAQNTAISMNRQAVYDLKIKPDVCQFFYLKN